MSLIEVKDLNVNYDVKKVLENISFNIGIGEYIIIVGPNGSGKSTLIKTILKLIKKTSGNIKYNINNEEISYMPQFNENIQKFPATVEEIVLMGTQRKSFKIPYYSKNDKQSAISAMNKFDIYNLRKKQISKLSGGQMQRVLLARAFCKDIKLIILDEPTSGLDVDTKFELYEIIEDLNETEKLSIIMITHDINEIKNDKATIMELLNGKIAFLGTVKEWKEKGNGKLDSNITNKLYK